MHTPEESQNQLADGGIPDLVRPAQPLMNPLDLVNRALRGFCSPQDSGRQSLQKPIHHHHRSDITSSSACLGTVDKKSISDTFHHDTCNSTISTSSDDWDDRDSTKGLGASHQDEDDDNDVEAENLVVIETVPGTRRIVRVVRALEIFLCTVALLIFTVVAAQRFGVQLEWRTKVDYADATFVSVMKQNSALEVTLEVPVETQVCTRDDFVADMLVQDSSVVCGRRTRWC